jgi:hypothetical protein
MWFTNSESESGGIDATVHEFGRECVFEDFLPRGGQDHFAGLVVED